ncbi:hypothetical protein H5410_042251 [Solanum commersonii]|uniref:Hydroxyproline-rich glycoprotein family protein n=1 Tax=Solanum commersonii TaxID=4109 RepID=A0A9J5XU87_SOLCO|nr:hypothetical protein H5410_042251 [Solanum commersonii]
MRGRSSPKQGGVMEVAKVDKLKQEPHLSGAYIRSLVKQLTSSRTKDPLNPKDHDDSLENSTKLDDTLCSDTQFSSPQPAAPPQIKKKQVRRRLHTSKPYQERLLNMAEARREIVTALKFHRASMKQQQQQQQSHTEPQSLQTWPQESLGEEQGKPKSRRNPRIYASNTMANNLPCYNMENFSNSTFPCLPQYPYSCPVSSFGSQLPFQDNMNFPLPNQTLGLNLNFHDFNNLDATPYCSSISNKNSILSSSSSSDEFHYVGEGVGPIGEMMNSRLHPSMDDQEMEEIRSVGEQHEMEWNDTLNLATSAWWFKFLKAMEIGPDEKNIAEDYGCYPFDEVMEFPPWFNPNETCLQQHVDDTYSHPTLPCMDIEEIEGMDVEWLA